MNNPMRLMLLLILFTVFFSFSLFSQIRETACVKYSGAINDKYPISMVLFTYNQNDRELVFGYYYYNKNNVPIYLTGRKDDGRTILTEELDNGAGNAEFKGLETGTGYSGTWKMKNKIFKFNLEITKDQVEIHKFTNENIEGIYKAKNDYITGDLTIDKKNGTGFFIDISTKGEAPHVGSAEGNLEKNKFGVWSYGVSIENEKTKVPEEKCALLFVIFDKKIFLFESGDPFYLDFGAQVYASGVYERK